MVEIVHSSLHPPMYMLWCRLSLEVQTRCAVTFFKGFGLGTVSQIGRYLHKQWIRIYIRRIFFENIVHNSRRLDQIQTLNTK